MLHSKALSDRELADRGHGVPRVRFLASTTPKSAVDGHLFHRYALRWGDAKTKAAAPTLTAADKTTTCDALLSPCLGYGGWWRFEHHGGYAVDSAGNHAPGTLDGAVLQQGAAVLSKLKDKVSLGAVPAPFSGAFTLEWTGRMEAFQGTQEPMLHCGTSPTLGFTAGKWSMGLNFTLGVASGPAPATQRVTSAAGTYAPSSGKTTLFIDGSQAGEATAIKGPDPKLSDGKCTLSSPGALGGKELRVEQVRVMSRALTADELLKWPRATWRVAS